MNYAAEEAVEDEETEESKTRRNLDAARDAAAALFLASVAGARPSPRGDLRPAWVAVKISALVSPTVLERASSAVLLASEEAAKDAKSDAPLFDRGALALDDAKMEKILTRAVDSGAMTEEDVLGLKRGEERLREIASAAAKKKNTRLIVDAEQTWLQPQIDVLALRAMREFNSITDDNPVVVQTYQCYLRSTPRRVAADALRASQEKFVHGAKPVRGAYLSAERAAASAKGLPDPVHGSIEGTHACYDAVVGSLLDGVKRGSTQLLVAVREFEKKTSFFFPKKFFHFDFQEKLTSLSISLQHQPQKQNRNKTQTHNRQSAEAAVAGMRARDLDAASSLVSFGQLLGMADSLTFGLAARGFDALKILAYGDLSVVCAFLVRRAQENASALGGARGESRAQAREVARRLFGSSK